MKKTKAVVPKKDENRVKVGFNLSCNLCFRDQIPAFMINAETDNGDVKVNICWECISTMNDFGEEYGMYLAEYLVKRKIGIHKYKE